MHILLCHPIQINIGYLPLFAIQNIIVEYEMRHDYLKIIYILIKQKSLYIIRITDCIFHAFFFSLFSFEGDMLRSQMNEASV